MTKNAIAHYESALKEAFPSGATGDVFHHWNEARKALAEQPAQQEPVALETVYETIIQWDEGGGKRSRRELARRIVALYTFPPAQRTWVGLTEQDIDIAFDDTQEGGGFDDFARAIEAKLKEKNT